MSDGGSLTGKSEMAYEILAYLAKNPDAQDTPKGVIEWWLYWNRELKSKSKKSNARLMSWSLTGWSSRARERREDALQDQSAQI